MSEASIRLPHDDRLARLAAAGDRNAFASIYRRHHQGVYRYCRSIVGNDEDAADALQNTMASAMQGLSGERREVALKPWLYRIAHNESISLLRRRRPEATMDDAEAAEATTGPALEGTAESRERLRQLVADLRDLPERQRGALLMRELSGLSYEEVAGVLEVSAAAAKQTVFEARSALHELSEGRAMACESVRHSISDRDGRVLRGRRVRAHLRDCASCRDFRDTIGSRGADLQALAPPLPALTAAGLLERLLGGGGDGPGGGMGIVELGGEIAAGQAAAVAGSGGWLAGVLGGSVAAKGAAAVVATTLAVGAGGVALKLAPGEANRAADMAGQTSGGRPDPAGPQAGDDHVDSEMDTRTEADVRDDQARDGDGDHAAGDDREGAADLGRDRRPADAPSRGRGERPGAPPSRTGRPEGARPPSGGSLPGPAEQHAGGQVPEQGSGTPGSQAPARAPDSTPALAPIPDRGTGSAPGRDAPPLPDIAPDAGNPPRP